MAAGDLVSAESGDDMTGGKGDGKLSLRMKLVTPVEEGSSERFSLQSKGVYSSDYMMTFLFSLIREVPHIHTLLSKSCLLL